MGKIHQLAIDAGKHRVTYAMFSFGGFMGMVNRFFAMPWKAFEFHAAEHKLILDSE